MKKSSILLLGWVWISVAPSGALGEAPAVSLSLTAEKYSIILGEPLFLTAHAKNDGIDPLSIYYQNSTTYELGDLGPFVVLIAEKGAKLERWSDEFGICVNVPPIRLAPGDELASNLSVLFSRGHGFAFKHPGDYSVSVKVICPAKGIHNGGVFQAEPLQITVNQPTGDSLKAWDILRGEEFKLRYGELMQTPWWAELNADDVKRCDDIIVNHPDAMQAEYLALYLGRLYSEGRKKDRARADHYLEIAKARASSEFLKSKVLEAIAKNTADGERERLVQAKQNMQKPEVPVAPELRRTAETVFRGFLQAHLSGDVEECMKLTAEEVRRNTVVVWNRAKQREEFQEDIDKIQKLRSNGVRVDLSARVLSVVWSGEDVVVTAVQSYREGSKPSQDKIVRCRLGRDGDKWLITALDDEMIWPHPPPR